MFPGIARPTLSRAVFFWRLTCGRVNARMPSQQNFGEPVELAAREGPAIQDRLVEVSQAFAVLQAFEHALLPGFELLR